MSNEQHEADRGERGRVSTEFTVWCGACWGWLQRSGPRRDAERMWRAEGWTKTRSRGWLCPDHPRPTAPEKP